jgi:5,6,7,8-tetrahydromethanopterin hydro-lyase
MHGEPYAHSVIVMFAETTQIGECFIGDGPDAAHVNTILGRYGGPVEVAWATALATPRVGHVAFVAVLRPNLPVQPLTLFVNKATIAGERHAELTWGAAQAGVAAGVADAVAAGILPETEATDLLLIAAVWVNPDARVADDVFANNRRAATEALANGAARRPAVTDVVAQRDAPFNPYYTPPAR